MINATSGDSRESAIGQIGSQPVALAAIVLGIIVLGIGSIALWRTTQERVTSARLTQARVAQASEQLVEKTKGLEDSQQQSIDQLQVVQDQLVVMTRLLAAQQAETRKLSEQVGGLTGALDNIRQSFASTQAASEAATQPSVRERPRRSRSHATATRGRPKAVAQRSRAKSRS